MIPLNVEASLVVAGLVVAFFRAGRSDVASDWSPRYPSTGLALALIVLTTIVAFAWMAPSYFLADDFILLVQAHAPLGWRSVFATRGGDGSFRPIGYLSFVASAKWADLSPVVWHWIGFGIHAINAMLLYWIAVALRYSKFTAWVAAMLFVVHGAHPEAVVWIAGRFDLLSTFFVLAAIATFLRWGESRKAGWMLAALIAMIGGLLAKESAYCYPLVAVLLVLSSAKTARGRTWVPFLAFTAITAALFTYRWHLLGGIGGYGSVSFLPSLKALAFRMWAILFFPVNWALPHRRWLVTLAVIYAAALLRLFFVRTEVRWLAFATGFALLAAAPAVSQLLIGADMEKARVLYLPSAGFCLLLAALLQPLPWRSQATLATVLLAFHGAVLWHNLNGWQRASEVVGAACEVAAQCSARPLVTGLPRTLDGVYTFANGFQECVAMRAKRAHFLNEAASCKFFWDPGTNTIRNAQ